MKKIVIVSVMLSAFAASAFVLSSDVEILKAVGCYAPVSCCDSLEVPLGSGESLTISKSTSGSSCLYQIQGSGSGVSFNVKVKDFNGGLVQAGDSIKVNSCSYTACGVSYNLRTSVNIPPVVSVSGDTVFLNYTECILPLNGTSGTVKLVWLQ